MARGYDTRIGGHGNRLSGGNRQRQNLAQALDGAPAVRVRDEATSAPGGETEAAAMQALDGLRRDCTLVMIGHHLSTVRQRDVLFAIGKDLIVTAGTCGEVMTAKEMLGG